MKAFFAAVIIVLATMIQAQAESTPISRDTCAISYEILAENPYFSDRIPDKDSITLEWLRASGQILYKLMLEIRPTMQKSADEGNFNNIDKSILFTLRNALDMEVNLIKCKKAGLL